MIDAIDLFSGIGGMHKGASEAGGFHFVWANDIDKWAAKVYKAQFPETPFYLGDIRDVPADSIPDHQLLCAGFPCQSFSVAGARGGFQDPRGTLFYEILRVIDAKRPQMLLLENVDGLLNHDEGQTFTTILWELGRRGYVCEWQVLNSNWFGIPQKRERVFIIGHLGGEPRSQVFPILETGGANPKVLATGVRAVNALHASDYKGVDNNGARTMIMEPLLLGSTNPHYKGEPRSKHLKETARTLTNGWSNQEDVILQPVPVLTPQRDKKRQNGRRFKNPGEPMFTLTAQDQHGVITYDGMAYKPRLLTPVERERLQGFPDGWTAEISDAQRIKTTGNAVTVNVVAEICRRIAYVSTQKSERRA